MGVYYGKADFVNYGKPSLFLDFANKKSLVDRISQNNLITFSRNSIGTYVGSDGLIKTASANEARFDHDPLTGESLGLLVEEARTNLATYSEQLNLWNNNGNAITISSNAETAPDGTLTADRISQSSTTNANRVLSNVNITYSSQTITMSIWARKVSGTDSGGRIGFGYNGDGVIRQYIDPTSTWQRYTYTRTLGASGSAAAAIMSEWDINGAANNNVYALWGFQVEAGSFPTSYIPTTSATVTRAADVASITGANFSNWYNQDEGTTFVETSIFETSQRRTLIGPISPNLPPMQTRYIGTESNLFQLSADGPNEAVSSPVVSSVFFKGAVAFRKEAIFAVASGQTVSTSRWTNFMLSGVTGWNMFQRGDGGAGRFNGIVSRLSHWPTLLPKQTLQYLTSASGSPSLTTYPYSFSVEGADVLALNSVRQTSTRDFVFLKGLTSAAQPRLTTAAQQTTSGTVLRDAAMLKASPTTIGNYFFSSGITLSGVSTRINGTPALSIATSPFSGSTATTSILLRELQPQTNWRISEPMPSGTIASPELAIPFETNDFVLFMKAGQS
jgi:hypothetical protein